METLLLPAVTLGATSALFVTLYFVISREALRGERVFLPRARQRLDTVVDWLAARHGIVWSAMQRMLPVRTASATDRQLAQALFRNATRTPLTVTHTKNHLSQMRDHKTETALTPAQGRKLRHKKLEERF